MDLQYDPTLPPLLSSSQPPHGALLHSAGLHFSDLIRVPQGVKLTRKSSLMPEMKKSANGLLGYSASMIYQLSKINGEVILEAAAGTRNLSSGSKSCFIQS